MRGRLALAALALAAGLAACGSEPLEAHTPIFVEAPWSSPERMHYNLTQRGELQGSCVLETDPEASPAITELRRLCTDAQEERYHDNAAVRVDTTTLRPLSSWRAVLDLRDGDDRHFLTTYLPAEGIARFESRQFEANEDEPRRTLTADRALPEPTAAVPDPSWYDDEELLWLVRGVPLTQGFAGAFTNVTAATGRVFGAEITVEEREQVEVPAGAFDAWKVRIETSTVTQLIWVDVEPPHRVVKANLERLTYELTAFE